ncbi:MAG TPA: SRPBCC family protein [Gemmatimonadaceae bacterium]|jgi:uncharacterized protein YndB with AHSA1/START domain
MKEYLTTTFIEAPPEKVWAILTDGTAYVDWNPEIVAVDGSMTLGAQITAHVRLGDGAVRRVRQRVQAFESPRRMVWVGGACECDLPQRTSGRRLRARCGGDRTLDINRRRR